MQDSTTPRSFFLNQALVLTAIAIALGLDYIVGPEYARVAFFALIVLFAARWVYAWSQKSTRVRRADGGLLFGQYQLRLSPDGFAVGRGYGPMRPTPWQPNWRVTLASFTPQRLTIRVERPLLGSLLISRPLVFVTDAARPEVDQAIAKMRQWIAEAADGR